MSLVSAYSNTLTSSTLREFEVSYSTTSLLLKAEQFSLSPESILGKFTVDKPRLNQIISQLPINQNNIYLQHIIEVLLNWKPQLDHDQLTENINQIISLWLIAVNENTHIDVILDLLKCINLHKKLSVFSLNSQSKNFQLFLFSLVIEAVSLYQETKLHYSLNHDPLTNLPNTNLLLIKLTDCLKKTSEDVINLLQPKNDKDEEHVGLISINFEIEKLTSILVQLLSRNLNIKIAALIEETLPANNSLFQLSNMQFAVVIEELSTHVQLNLIAAKIQRIFEQVLVIDNKSLRAIPIICCTYVKKADVRKLGITAEDMIQNLGFALENAIATNRNFVLYSPKIFEAIEAQKKLELEVIEAFNNDEFALYFQPIANIPDESCAGAEVLLRCPQSLNSGIYPSLMIDVINKVGLGDQFTRWLFNTTCRLGSELINTHKLDIYLTLNLRVEDLHNAELPHLLLQSIALWNLSPKDLVLEITENGILEDNEKTTANINQLAELGFKLALDDFGTGFSSLSRLRSMPISLIKVDQSFVRNIARSPEDYEIVKSISLLAASLGKEVLVEGVEDIDCLNLIKALQFKKVQGYYFAKPMPFEEFVAWASARPQISKPVLGAYPTAAA